MQDKARGSALITALFIMTLVAIAATAMSTRLQLDIYRTRLTLSSDQLYLASQAVSFWAMDTLTNEKNSKPQDFPSNMRHIYPGVNISGKLLDMQALFNLNNLQDKKSHAQFFKLLELTLPKSNDNQRKALVNAIVYWISPYQPDRGQDEFINYYLKQTPSYLPGYQLMKSSSELRLVRGVSQSIYQKLLPYITVLPEKTSVNINTAPKKVLMTLGNGLNESETEELILARRKKRGFNLKDNVSLLEKLGIPNEQITIESIYYLSVATTASKELNLTTYTVLKRLKDKSGHITISIVSQSLNTM